MAEFWPLGVAAMARQPIKQWGFLHRSILAFIGVVAVLVSITSALHGRLPSRGQAGSRDALSAAEHPVYFWILVVTMGLVGLLMIYASVSKQNDDA